MQEKPDLGEAGNLQKGLLSTISKLSFSFLVFSSLNEASFNSCPSKRAKFQNPKVDFPVANFGTKTDLGIVQICERKLLVNWHYLALFPREKKVLNCQI